ncbi:MAG TPA: glycosyltransferase family 2 protein [Nitrospinota bacterium]|jgi:glycosyltransferase involved in cell wall biosynthesis|nr:glycosyltransferase family 2 protein [Nitrospinota bacterium]HJN01700.1 glycosyltransferase family 2 protein [Nitrospinota bacterium]
MKLSIIIPVFNEENTIASIIQKVQSADYDKEIIVVDDASTDGTKDILQKLSQQPKLKIFYHERNRGKGAAIRTAIKNITGNITIIQDADLEYDPVDYTILLKPILDGRADVVYGSRFQGGSHRVLFFWHYLGNKLLTLFSNVMTNLNLTDMETGYKAFKSNVIKNISLSSDRFGFEPEVTAKIAHNNNYKIYEVPISYSGRDYSEGKKIGWKDGVAAIYFILKYNIQAKLQIRS